MEDNLHQHFYKIIFLKNTRISIAWALYRASKSSRNAVSLVKAVVYLGRTKKPCWNMALIGQVCLLLRKAHWCQTRPLDLWDYKCFSNFVRVLKLCKSETHDCGIRHLLEPHTISSLSFKLEMRGNTFKVWRQSPQRSISFMAQVCIRKRAVSRSRWSLSIRT